MRMALLNPRMAIGAIGFQTTRRIWKKIKHPVLFTFIAK